MVCATDHASVDYFASAWAKGAMLGKAPEEVQPCHAAVPAWFRVSLEVCRGVGTTKYFDLAGSSCISEVFKVYGGGKLILHTE